MNWERALLVATAIAATIAALASAVQGYVSWSGRNDYLRSTAVAQLVRACGNFEEAAERYVKINDRKQVYDFSSSFEVVKMSVAPLSNSAYKALTQEFKNFMQATNPSMDDKTYWDAYQKALTPLEAFTEFQCIQIVRQSIGG